MLQPSFSSLEALSRACSRFELIVSTNLDYSLLDEYFVEPKTLFWLLL
jgi:hypothetical protein